MQRMKFVNTSFAIILFLLLHSLTENPYADQAAQGFLAQNNISLKYIKGDKAQGIQAMQLTNKDCKVF